ESRLTVIYEAAEPIPDQSKPVPSLAGKRFIMYLGRPTPHKNLERLIQAFAKLQKTHPDIYLALAGKKDVLHERIEASVMQRGIQNVIFTDLITEGQLRWMF